MQSSYSGPVQSAYSGAMQSMPTQLASVFLWIEYKNAFDNIKI